LEILTLLKYGVIISNLVWGKTYSEIAEAFPISKTYISKVLKRWKDYEIFEDKRKSNGGSNKKLTKSKQDFMEELIETNRTCSLRQLANDLEEEFNIPFSYQIVSNSLREEG
jgi:transposase